MKITLLVLAFACAACGLAAAQDTFLTTSVDVMFAMHNACLVPTVAVTWQPGLFGIGVEIKVPVGTARSDAYLAALALLKIGWLDFGLGVSAMLAPPSGNGPGFMPPQDKPFFHAVRIGLTAPFLPLGPGKLGLNASMDYLVTATSLSTEMPQTRNLPELWSIEITANLVKASVGVDYTIGL